MYYSRMGFASKPPPSGASSSTLLAGLGLWQTRAIGAQEPNRGVPHRLILTMSWDDGFTADLRVAELMAEYGIRGTFYVPIRNVEGLPVLSPEGLRRVASLHEIGSHTYRHCYLDSVSAGEAEREIASGKAALEDMLGKSITGFCYPGGKFRRNHIAMVRNAGFSYARGIANLHTDLSFDRFMMPTTLQVYPHTRSIYIRNFLRRGFWLRRAAELPALLRGSELLVRLIECFETARKQDGDAVVHFWGHSWELDRIGGWTVLESFFQYVVNQPEVVMFQNHEVAAASAR